MTDDLNWGRRSLLAGSLAVAGCSLDMRHRVSGADTGAAANVLRTRLDAVVSRPGRSLSSLAVVALRAGEVCFESYFGQRWIDPHGTAHRPADADTLYRVASVSKWVTALGVLPLLERGRLALDEDISAYLGVVIRNPNFPAQPITLRMLLCHTSSLRDSAGYNFPESVDLRDVLLGRRAVAADRSAWSHDAAPGQHFAYCNLASGVVATIIEAATGQRFDRFMQQAVFAPLGILATFDPAALAPDMRRNLATLYRKRLERDGGEIWQPDGPWQPQVDDYHATAPAARASANYVPGRNGTLMSPQGGLRISARGLASLVRTVIAGGRHAGRVAFDPAWLDEMFRPQWQRRAAVDERVQGYEEGGQRIQAWGLGAQHFTDTFASGRGDWLKEGGGVTAVGHLGDAYGLTSAVTFDRRTGDGVIFLCGGVGFDPVTDPGRYSGFYRYEELILDATWRFVLAARTR